MNNTIGNKTSILQTEEYLIESMNSTPIVQKDLFQNYLIMIGIRSHEFTYDDKILFDNVEYFKKCFEQKLSAYKALLFLSDYLNNDYKI